VDERANADQIVDWLISADKLSPEVKVTSAFTHAASRGSAAGNTVAFDLICLQVI
jgi:hypothetical protein